MRFFYLGYMGAASLVAAQNIFSYEEASNDSSFQDHDTFDWYRITPTKDLIFHSCFDGLECARLDVPMNYNRTDGKGSRVSIAITRLRSKVDVTDPRYGGAILINPGGPGGSGVDLVRTEGRSIQLVVDASESPSSLDSKDDKYFDIVGWDPRGVANTQPRMVCFPDPGEQLYWSHMLKAERSLQLNSALLGLNIARGLALSTSCSQRLLNVTEDEDSIAEHLNTPAVVADMVSIIEALGEWRENEARLTLAMKQTGHMQTVLSSATFQEDEAEILERTRWNRGEEKLQCYGFSYGTILGATFATLEPQKVGRVVIDGVVNLEDYYKFQNSKVSLLDSELALRNLLSFCAQAGPDKCPFARDGSTLESLEERLDVIIANLTKQPLSIISSNWDGSLFGVITARILLDKIFYALYSPLEGGTQVMKILKDIEQGDGSLLNGLAGVNEGPHSWCPESGPCSEKQRKPYEPQCPGPPVTLPIEVIMSITCADSLTEFSSDPEDVRKLIEERLRSLAEQTDKFQFRAIDIAAFCSGWKAKSARKFILPENVTTSHPLLIVSNTADPVCPLINAYNTSSRFVDSVVLTNNGTGHCSINAPSLCMIDGIKEYFQTGKMPLPGTVCQPYELPFVGRVNELEKRSSSVEREEFLDAVRRIGSMIGPKW